ncbi:MAG: alpha-amylase family glycosyl hydrolase [Nitrospinota bacterium]
MPGQVLMKTEKRSARKKSLRFTQTLHNAEPDYSKPVLEIPPEARERMFRHLRFLYGEEAAAAHLPELERILKVYYAHKTQEMLEKEADYNPDEPFTEEDMIFITYGDLIRGDEGSPLATLAKFCETYLRGINTLHLLPFFPSSSDRGFSVIDFKSVDPHLGTWRDISVLENRYRLMFDGVINHVSSQSHWFREFLDGNPQYKDFFIVYESPENLTVQQRGRIFRPRTSDILTRFLTLNGPRYVWTTFSSDQIDLNYKNPKVLLGVIDLLLFYVCRGADIVRLDAAGYLWAEPGTSCVHLAQTHEIIRLFRTVLETVAPLVTLVTETNVPHQENVSYFGNGHDQAHMVYNFALPPLVLHTFYTEDVTVLSRWAQQLKVDSNGVTFLNILDTHDGIGLMGVKEILTEEERGFLLRRAEENGACISYKAGENGSKEPYEINTTWWSALNREQDGEDLDLQVRRFIASRSLALVVQGVPGIYLHGALGTNNAAERVLETGSKRAINRQMIDSRTIAEDLRDPRSKLSQIVRRQRRINVIRTSQRAFHPHGGQQVLRVSPKVFAVLRVSPEGDQHVLTLTNVSRGDCEIEVDLAGQGVEDARWFDLIGGKEWAAEGEKIRIALRPYEVIWLKPHGEIEEGDIACQPTAVA